MLESLMQQLKRGSEQLQRRSGEMAHSARLRLEVYQLAREQDALYGRLGRAYHAGVDKSTLDEMRAEIRQLEQDITGREHLIAELGEDDLSEPAAQSAATQSAAAQSAGKGQHGSPATGAGHSSSAPSGPFAPAPTPTVTAAAQTDLQPPSPEPAATHPRWTDPPAAQDQGAATPLATAPAAPSGSLTASRIWRAKERERHSSTPESR